MGAPGHFITFKYKLMANPNDNRTDAVISNADLVLIADGFTNVLKGLEPYTHTLVQEERDSLFSLAEENLVFAQDAQTQGLLLQSSFPAQMQKILTNMANDLSLRNQLDEVFTGVLGQVTLRIEDTRRLAAHEAYSAALAIYKCIEAGAALGLDGYQAAYQVLKARFSTQGGRPQGTP